MADRFTVDTRDRVLVPTADGSLTVFDPVAGRHMHSLDGAVAESIVVYRDTVKLNQRFANGCAVNILEVGFGSGLNFVLAAQAAEHFPAARLVYHSWEPFPLPPDVVHAYHAGSGTAGRWAEWAAAPTAQLQLGNVQLVVHTAPWPPPRPLPACYHAVYYDP
jgi:tRNA U34 5-methylaminomethyl-2-thiouridine-forming methyltransferase MnmC